MTVLWLVVWVNAVAIGAALVWLDLRMSRVERWQRDLEDRLDDVESQR